MIKKFFQNTCKPEGWLGRIMLRGMNSGHAPLANWGLSMVHPATNAHVLDIGCGGGANIAKLLHLCPLGVVDGIDYSAESVAFSRRVNADSLGTRCDIRKGDVSALPYDAGKYDLVTAFETVYFWPGLDAAFAEIWRVLKPGGQLLIVCELDDESDTTWTGLIDGLTVYSGENLAERVEMAGFESVILAKHKKGWICVRAIKGDVEIAE